MTNSAAQTVEERLVRIAAGSVKLDGNLSLPDDARAVVLFAHGSGSSRHSRYQSPSRPRSLRRVPPGARLRA